MNSNFHFLFTVESAIPRVIFRRRLNNNNNNNKQEAIAVSKYLQEPKCAATEGFEFLPKRDERVSELQVTEKNDDNALE
jgi:hypothetical protein